jgi:hypothetical protein
MDGQAMDLIHLRLPKAGDPVAEKIDASNKNKRG